MKVNTACFLACIISTFIMHALAGESVNYKCGPGGKCKCFLSPWSKYNITMDCSGRLLGNFSQICDNLGNATRLDASFADIGSILDESGTQGCDNLLYLSLRDSSMFGVKLEAFKYMSSLESVDLSHNNLPLYTYNLSTIFEDLVNLTTLKINGNHFHNPGVSLWYPDLTSNMKLSSLHADGLHDNDIPFPALKNLKTLVLSGLYGSCSIEKINDNFFENLLQLETLDLSLCNIYEISFNSFSSLQNLRRLDISNNRRLGMRALYNVSHSLQFTQIDFLNYSHVYSTFGLGIEIRKLDICFLRNTTLRELALNGNRIQMLETNAMQLLPPTLQIIHVNDNEFEFGPFYLQLSCAANMTEFYGGFQYFAHNPLKFSHETHIQPETPWYTGNCPFMDDTYLQNISAQIDNCPFYSINDTVRIYPTFPKYLKKIIINNNHVEYTLAKFLVFPLANSLEYMDASGNIFHDWEGPVGPAAMLKYLDLSRNYCTHIGDKFFEYCTALQNLQIHSNFLGLSSVNGDAYGIFSYLTNLKTMNLSINRISNTHPRTFEGLTNLETIDLSYNSISRWTLNVETLSNLAHVNLSNNAVQTLPVSLYEHLEDVSKRLGSKFTIDLRNNTLKYGCPTKDFLLWMVDHRHAFVGFSEYMFVNDDGDRISAHSIGNQVKELEKKCKSNLIWIAISCIGVSVALSVIIFGLVYRNRWKLRYFMYMSKQRFYGYVRIPNDEPLENFKYDAFVSYEERTIRFIKEMIIPKLEQNGVCLCVHQRDFLPGNAIADNIVDAIQSSRKTVVLLTKAFLKSKWCMYEFNMARMENIYSRDGRGCLILVMLEEVSANDMSPELLDWIRRESYLEYSTDEDGENLFWNNLKDAIRQ